MHPDSAQSRRAARFAIAALVLLCLGYGASAGAAEPTPRFTPLPFFSGPQPYGTAFGVSGDGSTAVGWASSSTTPAEAVRWTGGGIESLNALMADSGSRATAANADGSVVVGQMPRGPGVSQWQAFRWQNGTAVGLGTLNPASNALSIANGVSGDGSVVVGGTSALENGTPVDNAFRWTAAGGMVPLGDLPGGQASSVANGVSRDGNVIVGSSIINGQVDHAFRWTSASGMVDLGTLPGQQGSVAQATNADGSVVVGSSWVPSNTGGTPTPFRWENGVMQDLGTLDRFENGNRRGIAYDVSADGNTIVGVGPGLPGGSAMIWTAEKGMRTLYTVLNWDLKIDMTGWSLSAAQGVSDDGLTVVGYGVNPQGQIQAFLAVVPEPSSLALCAAAGLLALRRRRC